MSSLFSRTNRFRTGFFISIMGLTFYSFPMVAHLLSRGPIIDSDKPLKPEAIRRGAFNNSGSRDIGPDPDWENGVRKPKRRKVKSSLEDLTKPSENPSQ